jgi:hypothetical protein
MGQTASVLIFPCPSSSRPGRRMVGNRKCDHAVCGLQPWTTYKTTDGMSEGLGWMDGQIGSWDRYRGNGKHQQLRAQGRTGPIHRACSPNYLSGEAVTGRKDSQTGGQEEKERIGVTGRTLLSRQRAIVLRRAVPNEEENGPVKLQERAISPARLVAGGFIRAG